MTQSVESSSTLFRPEEHVHRRFNPLTGKHVLVSPHRSLRPWNGQTEPTSTDVRPSYDPGCYLCPGNERSTGHSNPQYEGVYIFDNDFPALLPDSLPQLSTKQTSGSEFFQSDPVRGSCKVICFHPRHDLSMASMKPEELNQVLDGWKKVYKEEGSMIVEKSSEGCVQIFENRGAMMGCSAPHPHGQVWTTSFIPDEHATELSNFRQYLSTHPSSSHLLLDYAKAELDAGERVVTSHESGWLAVVPFWATWPFEVLILPSKRHIPSILQMSEEEQAGLAAIMKDVLARYDNLFSCPFPYSMGLHQAPLPPKDAAKDPSQVHLHFYPPLLRSATIRKFMVGFELMGESQRDIPPEQAATRLRASSASITAVSK
ncbi:galactose-1-phosphate uridylyltransferase [Kwoniella shandongensis]|uniref:Galactose-1-phosphate uridylyltransferase n=1 Tax=Kwoniella shandongensis TaxID=1734106 RepID=A0A5M6BT73_9TREE|nr:galactose-1-phosphate uridylyltransferase [Kwoniella shandongensis]KAA5526068.1 galactose-1-phosphate uridylyltransferase [Kwoniella shandongensis]